MKDVRYAVDTVTVIRTKVIPEQRLTGVHHATVIR